MLEYTPIILGKTALHHAVDDSRNGRRYSRLTLVEEECRDDGLRLRCVQLLSRDERVDINIKDKNGETPITLAMKRGKTEMVKILLDNPGVDLDTMDKEGRFLENIAR